MQARIRERGNTYTVSIEVWHEGKRKSISGGTFTTKDDAKRAAEKLTAKHLNGNKGHAHSTITLENWVERWLNSLSSDQKKENTIRTYRWRMNKWILPYLGKTRLVDLSKGQILHWLDELGLESGLKFGAKKAALTTLSSCLTDAFSREQIEKNPCAEVKLDQSKAVREAAKRKMKVWSVVEAQRLFDSSNDMDAVIVALGLYGALRRGEIIGLEWQDVDWMDSSLNVCHNVVGSAEGVLLDESPKSGVSRTVKLSPPALDALARWRDTQDPGEVRVVPLSPRQVQTRFERIQRAADVPLLGMHALRHTCASLLLSAGVSLVAVSHHLGHSKPSVTLDFYGHLMPSDANRCAEALQTALSPPGMPVAV